MYARQKHGIIISKNEVVILHRGEY